MASPSQCPAQSFSPTPAAGEETPRRLHTLLGNVSILCFYFQGFCPFRLPFPLAVLPALIPAAQGPPLLTPNTSLSLPGSLPVCCIPPRMPGARSLPIHPPVKSPSPLSDSSSPHRLWAASWPSPAQQPDIQPQGQPPPLVSVTTCRGSSGHQQKELGTKAATPSKAAVPAHPTGTREPAGDALVGAWSAPTWPQRLSPPLSPVVLGWENAVSLNLQRNCQYKSLR